MCASLAGYLALIAALPRTRHALVARAFAAAAISTYYWYRLPSLIGLGLFPGEGRLVDLSEIVAGDAILVLQVTVTAFWGWWLVVRRPSRSWQGRRLRERVWLAGRFRFGLGPPASDLDFRLQTSDFGLRTSDFGLRTSYFG